jgi:kumamolisin
MSADSSFSSKPVQLPDSERPAVPSAKHIGKADGTREIRVSVILKRKAALDLKSLKGRHLSRAELNEKYGASRTDFDRVWTFAQAHGLRVDQEKSSLERRRVELHGPISAFNKAFGVDVNDYESTDPAHKGSFHAITGALTVPESMVNSVEAVLGLDNRPIATPKMRLRPRAAGTDGTFTPPQVAQIYNFPTGVTGTGQTIGIIELGGGFTTTDIASYFKQLGIAAPNVTAVLLDGGSNAPTNANSADGEVMLDIEVAGSVAPGANIVVYFTTNTDQGFQDAISTAIHDTTNNPSVISISWGGPESGWAQTAINSMDSTCRSAAALGISITVASGDNGSTDGTNTDTVDFPASSPHVLACGGTALVSSNGQRTSETVWNDQAGGGGASGGGYSKVFALPDWQTSAVAQPAKKHQHKKHASSVAVAEMEEHATKPEAYRGVPDVAGNASPETGYQVLVDGQQMVVGGTSAVAPLWAGLIALMNQQLGKNLGFINPLLYPLKESPFYDVTSGTNGDYSAGPGWDPCTGLGSPNGQSLVTAL